MPLPTWTRYPYIRTLKSQDQDVLHLQIRSKAVLANRKFLESWRKRKPDLLTNIARAEAAVNPKLVYAEEIFECPRFGQHFQKKHRWLSSDVAVISSKKLLITGLLQLRPKRLQMQQTLPSCY